MAKHRFSANAARASGRLRSGSYSVGFQACDPFFKDSARELMLASLKRASRYVQDFVDLGDGGSTSGENGEVRANNVRDINDSGQTHWRSLFVDRRPGLLGEPDARAIPLVPWRSAPPNGGRAAYDVNSSGQVAGRIAHANAQFPGGSDFFVTGPNGNFAGPQLISAVPRSIGNYGDYPEYEKDGLNDSGLFAGRILDPTGTFNVPIRWNPRRVTPLTGRVPIALSRSPRRLATPQGRTRVRQSTTPARSPSAFFNPNTTGLFDAFVTDSQGANATSIRGRLCRKYESVGNERQRCGRR